MYNSPFTIRPDVLWVLFATQRLDEISELFVRKVDFEPIQFTMNWISVDFRADRIPLEKSYHVRFSIDFI